MGKRSRFNLGKFFTFPFLLHRTKIYLREGLHLYAAFNRPFHMIPLLLSIFLFSPSAQSESFPGLNEPTRPLVCRPIAVSNQSLPELCTPESFREELVSYLNHGEIYFLNAVRFLDRVELDPNVAQPVFLIGNGKSVLRMNPYVRIRDAKDLPQTLAPRLRLIEASKEIKAEFERLKTRTEFTPVNLEISMKDFLDSPFIMEKREHHFADKIVPETPKPIQMALASQPYSQSMIIPASDTQGLAQCRTTLSQLIDAKERLENKVSAIKKDLVTVETAAEKAIRPLQSGLAEEELNPREAAQKLNSRELASSEANDCRRCGDVVQFCQKQGTLPVVSQVSLENCRFALRFPTCTQSLPASLRLKVEGCKGTPPVTLLTKYRFEEVQTRKQIAMLAKKIRDTDAQCTHLVPDAELESSTDEAETTPVAEQTEPN